MTDVATYEEQRWYPRLLFMGAASPHRCGVCRSTPANESVLNTGEGRSGAGDDPGTTESVAKPGEGHSYESDLPELSDSGFDSSSDDDDPPGSILKVLSVVAASFPTTALTAAATTMGHVMQA